MSRAEARFLKKLGTAWEGATPGFCLQAYRGGRKKIDLRVGRTYHYYDWASLTKIVFSATALMTLIDQKKLHLATHVRDELEWFRSPAPTERQRVRNLLSHSAGLTWWMPFYKSLNTYQSRGERWQQLETLVAREMAVHAKKKNAFTKQALYSDLDFFSLGAILRRKTGQDFEGLWPEIAERLRLSETRFHVDNRAPYSREHYAPTENCPWRGRVLQGEVHDENTWALGGVAPHAGLFGPIDELSKWGLALRKGILGREASSAKRRLQTGMLAQAKTVQKFARRSIPRSIGDWALGLTMPAKGGASCGRYFSLQSVGHLGFTGTSLWFDPKQDLLVTILANRVYPTRENKKFPQMRGALHDWVFESLEGRSK